MNDLMRMGMIGGGGHDDDDDESHKIIRTHIFHALKAKIFSNGINPLHITTNKLDVALGCPQSEEKIYCDNVYANGNNNHDKMYCTLQNIQLSHTDVQLQAKPTLLKYFITNHRM